MNTTAFGTDHSIDELIEKIKGASIEDASPSELQKFIAALKIIADETIARHESVRKIERELREKNTLADLIQDTRNVLGITVPGKRRYEPTYKQAWRAFCTLGQHRAY